MSKSFQPPKLLDRLLEWYCKPELLEDLQGDLHEYYYRNLSKGRWKANLIFLIDVIKFYRLYTTQKPKLIGQMNLLTMIRNYLKTSIRSIFRNKLFSTINVVGLAISMSVGILMITYLSELLSYDTFHEKADRVFRVTTNYLGVEDEGVMELASTSIFIGDKLKHEVSGIENLVLLRRNFNVDIETGEHILNSEGLWASSEFFEVFSFHLIAGDYRTCLQEPNSVVITESLSKKLFQEENPIGKLVKLHGQEYYQMTNAIITGVVADPPVNSHIQFEILGSFSTLKKYANSLKSEKTFVNSYSSIWMNYVYLSIPENKKSDEIQSALDQIAIDEGKNYDRFRIDYLLENIKDVTPGRELSNQLGSTMEWNLIYILSALTVVVLLSACFNYTNLSVARLLRRGKEVSIRKIVGAERHQVFGQFLLEAVLIALISLILAIGIYLIIKPEFLDLVISDGVASLDFSIIHVLYFLVFALLTGFLAGIIPSTIISKMKAISVLRDATKVQIYRGVSLRKILLVIQFTLSISFIIAATISYRQYQYALNFDLGFSTENILNVRVSTDDVDVLINRYKELPEIQSISRSGMVPGIGEIWSENVKYKDPMDSADIHINYIDSEYTKLHGYELVAGDNFNYDSQDSTVKLCIVNEQLLHRFSIKSAQDAIGEDLVIRERKKGLTKLRIVGVVKDFHYAKISDDIKPVALIQDPKNFGTINIKLSSNDVIGSLDKMEMIWKEIDPIHPFEAKFYDDQLQSAYVEYQIYFKIIGFLAFLTISIAMMGLFGMAVFTTETRIKEISIRKVLGATEKGLVLLLSKSFVYLMLIAALIAVPATYYLFDEVVLGDVANRISFGFIELFLGVLVIFVFGLLTIGWQTFKAARANPATMLKDE